MSELIYPSDPPKNPIIAAVLSFLIGGVGQIYLGQSKKGIILLLAWLLGFCSLGLVTTVVAILGAIDAYNMAEKLQQGESVAPMQWFWDK